MGGRFQLHPGAVDGLVREHVSGRFRKPQLQGVARILGYVIGVGALVPEGGYFAHGIADVVRRHGYSPPSWSTERLKLASAFAMCFSTQRTETFCRRAISEIFKPSKQRRVRISRVRSGSSCNASARRARLSRPRT